MDLPHQPPAIDRCVTLGTASEPCYARGSGRTWLVSQCALSTVWAYWLYRHDDHNESMQAARDTDTNEKLDRGSTLELEVKRVGYNLCVKRHIYAQICTRKSH